MYSFIHYSFTGIYGTTDSHIAGATYSVILSRSTQFSATAGIARYENTFVELVPIDPAIAAIIGISSAQRVSYQAHIIPNLSGRLSPPVPRGTIFLHAMHRSEEHTSELQSP